jgi:hypothetical protein
MNPQYIIFGIFLITLFSTLFVMFTKIALEEYLKADESELKPMSTKTTYPTEQTDFNGWANFIHNQNKLK